MLHPVGEVVGKTNKICDILLECPQPKCTIVASK